MLLAEGSHFLLAWFPWIYGGISNYFGKISTNSSKVRAGKSSTLLYSGFTLKIIYEIVYGLALLNYKRGDYFSSKTSLATAFLASPSSKRSSISRSSRPIRLGLPRSSVICNFSCTADDTITFATAEEFTELMKQAGNDYTLHPFEGKDHKCFIVVEGKMETKIITKH